MNNFESKIKPALIAKHGDMTNEGVAVFRRKWEVSCLHPMFKKSPSADNFPKYYFRYCEAGFLSKTLGDVIITVGREGALELMEDIPK